MMSSPSPISNTTTFTCEYCQKEFPRSQQLKRHIRKHTGEKPFPCLVEGCDKSFSRSDNRTQHMLSHTRKRVKAMRKCMSDSEIQAIHKVRSHKRGGVDSNQEETHATFLPTLKKGSRSSSASSLFNSNSHLHLLNDDVYFSDCEHEIHASEEMMLVPKNLLHEKVKSQETVFFSASSSSPMMDETSSSSSSLNLTSTCVSSSSSAAVASFSSFLNSNSKSNSNMKINLNLNLNSSSISSSPIILPPLIQSSQSNISTMWRVSLPPLTSQNQTISSVDRQMLDKLSLSFLQK